MSFDCILDPWKEPQVKVDEFFFLEAGQVLNSCHFLDGSMGCSGKMSKFIGFGINHLRERPDMPQRSYHQKN